MKRFLIIALILTFITQASTHALSAKKDDVQTSDAIQQINQINQSFESMDSIDGLNEEEVKQMGYGIDPTDKKKDLQKKYNKKNDSNENAVSLNLNKKDTQEQIEEKTGEVFNLHVEKNDPYQDFRYENMFWDTSKNFLNTYYQDFKNQLPMPTMINSSSLSRDIDSNTTVQVGQTALSDFNGLTVDFVRSMITTYDTGAKITTRGDKINFSAGAFNSTLNFKQAGGAVLSTNSLTSKIIPGNLIVGGGLYSSDMDDETKHSGGLFAQYKVNRLKLNASVAKSQYSNTNALDTGLYFVPELQLTKSLSLKTRFVQNITQNTNQDEFGLSFRPQKGSSRDLLLELNAANTYSESQMTKQRIKFSASFKI